MATTTTKRDVEESATAKPDETLDRRGAAAGAATGAATTATELARDAASQVATRLPDLASATLATYERANTGVHAASDELLTLGTAVSFGFAIGLLIGGANRLLIGAAFVPVAMMGFTLLERASSKRAAVGPAESKGL